MYLQVLAGQAGAVRPARPVRHDAVIGTRHRTLHPVPGPRRAVAQRLVRHLGAVPPQAGDALEAGARAAGLARPHGEGELAAAPRAGGPVVAGGNGAAAGLVHGWATTFLPLDVLHLTSTDLVT